MNSGDNDENSLHDLPKAKRRKMSSSSAPLRDQSNHERSNHKSSPPLEVNDKELRDLGLDRIDESGDRPAVREKSFTASERDSSSVRLSSGRAQNSGFRTRLSDSFSLSRPIKKKYEQTPVGPNYFNNLSDEIIIHIFQFLPKVVLVCVSSVCKKFYEIFQDESFWRRLDVGSKTLPSGAIGQILHRGTGILRAARTTIGSPLFTNKNGKIFYIPEVRECRLQYLDLSAASISVTDLETVLGVCKRLRKLSLENLDISHNACVAIAENSVLNTLNMGITTGVSKDGIKAILKNCRQLRELNMAWTNLSLECLDALTKNLNQNIERLNIAGCRETMKDDHVKEIVTNCKGLQELDISDAIYLTEASVHHICHLKKLECLSTNRCYNIIPNAYLNLVQCESLVNFNIHNILKDQGLMELERRLPKVKINETKFSSIARPTVGVKRSSVWGLKTRD